MSGRDWLKMLKPGDEVGIKFGHLSPPIERRVERVTPAGRIIIGTYVFNPDGRQRTDDRRNRRWLVEMTDELRMQMREEDETAILVAELNSVGWRSLPLPTLRAVSAALKAARELPVEAKA